MLLRQALEQTRSGAPTPMAFNSRMVGLEPADEAFGIFHTEPGRASFRSLHAGSAGIEVFSSRPHPKAAAAITGTRAS